MLLLCRAKTLTRPLWLLLHRPPPLESPLSRLLSSLASQDISPPLLSNQLPLPPAHHALPQTEIAAILESLRHLGVDKPTIEHLVDFPYPSLLALFQKVQLLLMEDFAPLQVKTLLTMSGNKIFFKTSYEKLLSIIKLLKTRDVTGKIAGNVLTRTPGVLRLTVDHLERNLKFFEELGLEKEGLQRVISVTRLRSVLGSSVETLQKHVDFLRGIGMNMEGIQRIVSKYPQFFLLNIERNLEPTVDFFESKGMNRKDLCKLVRLHPHVFGASLDQGLTKKLELLQQLGLMFNGRSGYRAFSSWSTCSCELLLARFDYLKSLGLSHAEASKMVQTQPDILGRSEESLKKKIHYLVNVLNRDIHELVKYPAYLSCSLEERVIPRFNTINQWKRKGLLNREISLGAALAPSNEVFEKRYVANAPRNWSRRQKMSKIEKSDD